VTTTGQRLVEISQLSTGTAAQHLRAAGVTGSTAGELLVSYSQLPTATAIVHLLQTVQREAAGGVPKFRRMVTTPSVVAEAHFGWNVEFPSILLGLVPLPVSGVISPTVARTTVSVVNPQQKPNTACSTALTVSVSYSTWEMLLPHASAIAPFTGETLSGYPVEVVACEPPKLSASAGIRISASVAHTVVGSISTRSVVMKPKSIRNPSEQEMIALLFS
jgi:hypothetical protein